VPECTALDLEVTPSIECFGVRTQALEGIIRMNNLDPADAQLLIEGTGSERRARKGIHAPHPVAGPHCDGSLAV
jgi:hypothetical protein